MKMVFKLLNVFLEISLFLLVSTSVFILLTSKTAIFKGIRSFIEVSGSMLPDINVGSIVLTFNKPSFQIGDIISFENQAKQVITHRIVDKVTLPEGNFYETKGDSNRIADNEPVPQKSVIGGSFLIIPYLGYLINALMTPSGFIGIIIAPAFLFIIMELWNIKHELEYETRKKIGYKFRKLYFI